MGEHELKGDNGQGCQFYYTKINQQDKSTNSHANRTNLIDIYIIGWLVINDLNPIN